MAGWAAGDAPVAIMWQGLRRCNDGVGRWAGDDFTAESAEDTERVEGYERKAGLRGGVNARMLIAENCDDVHEFRHRVSSLREPDNSRGTVLREMRRATGRGGGRGSLGDGDVL